MPGRMDLKLKANFGKPNKSHNICCCLGIVIYGHYCNIGHHTKSVIQIK
jgi:hypothetical protein